MSYVIKTNDAIAAQHMYDAIAKFAPGDNTRLLTDRDTDYMPYRIVTNIDRNPEWVRGLIWLACSIYSTQIAFEQRTYINEMGEFTDVTDA